MPSRYTPSLSCVSMFDRFVLGSAAGSGEMTKRPGPGEGADRGASGQPGGKRRGPSQRSTSTHHGGELVSQGTRGVLGDGALDRGAAASGGAAGAVALEHGGPPGLSGVNGFLSITSLATGTTPAIIK